MCYSWNTLNTRSLTKSYLEAFVESSPTWMAKRCTGSPGRRTPCTYRSAKSFTRRNCSQLSRTQNKAHWPWWLRNWCQDLIHFLWPVLPVKGAPAKGHTATSIHKGCETASKRDKEGKGQPCFEALGRKSLWMAADTTNPFTQIRGSSKGSQQKKPELGRCYPIWGSFPLKLCTGNSGHTWQKLNKLASPQATFKECQR